jgi:predicted transcriptional regulator
LPKRGWGSITIEVLEATLQPQRKMRIMYKANLNFARFNKYFYDLLEKGFIEKVGDPDEKSLYKISSRGKTLLDALKKVRDLASSSDY